MVYVMLAAGFEEIEALTVVDVLRRAEIEVCAVSCEKTLNVTGAHGITVEADILLRDAGLEQSLMIVLPGGMPGTINLLENPELVELLKEAYAGKTKLAAICAAPIIFGKLGFLDGKSAVCYPGFEHELKGALASELRVVTDGKLTTSKGPGTALDFAFELVTILKDEKTASKLKGDMLAK